MRAIILEKFGGAENLIYKTIDKPQVKPDEVLIKVRAFSVNPVDAKVRSGKAPLAKVLDIYNPLVLGWDVSGEIVEVGSQITKHNIGDAVFGMVNFAGHGKAYAEYVAVPEDHITFKPQNLSHIEAAASTMAALTAWQAFNSYGKLRPQDKILIHAASGGVGHFAVQIAKHMGAQVTATSSSSNRDFVLSLGADHHIDYRAIAYEEVLKDMDFVLESIGGENFKKSIKVLKPFGTIVALPSGHTKEDELKAKAKNLHACYFMSVYSSKQDMEHIASLLRKGVLKPHVSQVLNFEEITKAHHMIESERTVGKIVVAL